MKALALKAIDAFGKAAVAVVLALVAKHEAGVHVTVSDGAAALVPALAAAVAVVYHGVPALLGKAKTAQAVKFAAAVQAAVNAQAAAQVVPGIPQP